MLTLGQKFQLIKTFSEDEVLFFSKLSKDENPIHFDEEYAADSIFKQRIVQGPFVMSLIGGVLGSNLPGPGTIYLSQSTRFLKPVYIGDTINVNVEVVKVRNDKPIITLRTWVEKNDNQLVIEGEAVIMFLKK